MAPVMVFLISSPLMSPSAFLITWGGLGLSMALWKLFSAVALGLAAGWVTDLLSRQGYLGESILRIPAHAQEDSCSGSCSASESDVQAGQNATITKKNLLTFLRLSGKFGLLIGKFTIIAIIAQAFMRRFVPQDWITTAVGMQNSYAVIISTIVGIPAYLNSLSAVPLLQGLMDLGMDKGAALAFIIAGPVMSVPSIIAVMALFKRQALYVYITVGFLGALLFGSVYRWFPTS
jgi:uncharacterized membrane protein YraQ (UPF0718 family)